MKNINNNHQKLKNKAKQKHSFPKRLKLPTQERWLQEQASTGPQGQPGVRVASSQVKLPRTPAPKKGIRRRKGNPLGQGLGVHEHWRHVSGVKDSAWCTIILHAHPMGIHSMHAHTHMCMQYIHTHIHVQPSCTHTQTPTRHMYICIHSSHIMHHANSTPSVHTHACTHMHAFTRVYAWMHMYYCL